MVEQGLQKYTLSYDDDSAQGHLSFIALLHMCVHFEKKKKNPACLVHAARLCFYPLFSRSRTVAVGT